MENPTADSWRKFVRSFSIPSSAVNLSGTLHVTSDNAEEVKLNNTVVGTDGEVFGPFIDNQEWNTVLSYPANPVAGANTLETVVRNYPYGTTDPKVNPTGLIYKMDYQYQLVTTETAWGAGSQFAGANWATYFTYAVQGILTGTWLLDVNGGAYMHDMFIVSQSSSGALTGTGGYPASGPPYAAGYDWTLTGQLTGNSVTLVIIYTNAYTTTLTGTVVVPSWNSMSGTGTSGVIAWVATRLP